MSVQILVRDEHDERLDGQEGIDEGSDIATGTKHISCTKICVLVVLLIID